MFTIIVLFTIPCSQYIECLDLKIASILRIWFSLIDIYVRCGLTNSLFLRPVMNKQKQRLHSVAKYITLSVKN